MIQRVLLALDGSERAERALPHTLQLAKAFAADVVLLRVVDGRGGGGSAWADPVAWRMERSEAVAYLDTIKARFVEAGVTVDLDVGAGQPAEEILETARVRKVDLVVITTHGLGEALAVPLAGTAHKVVGGADTSVLVVPAGIDAPSNGIRRLVVGVDGSHRSEWALCLAVRLARGARIPLLLSYVVPAPEILDVGDSAAAMKLVVALMNTEREAGERYLRGLAARIDAPDLEFSTRAIEGHAGVPRALGDLAAEEPGSLLVVSAHGAGAWRGVGYGTVARALVEEGRLPILVLRDAPRAAPPQRCAPASGRRARSRASPAA